MGIDLRSGVSVPGVAWLTVKLVRITDVDRSVPRLAFAASAVVAVATIAATIGAYGFDYSEGVYWQSLLSLDAGHQLFSQVFSSQPPLFLLSVLPAFELGGQSLVAARLMIVAMALTGVAATVVLGRRVSRGAGWFAGALFLAGAVASSLHVEATVPAVSLSVVAVAIANRAGTRTGRRRLALAALAGVVLATATMIKLLGAVAVVPAVLVLALPPHPPDPFDDDAPDRDTGPTDDVVATGTRSVRWAIAPALVLVGAAVLGVALVAALTWRDGAMYEQVVGFHLHARSIRSSTLDNIKILAVATLTSPLLLVAVAGIVLAAWLRVRDAIVPAAWLATAAGFLLLHHPMFASHRFVLVPPAALAVASLPTWVGRRWHASTGRLDPRGWATVGVAIVVLGSLVLAGATAFENPSSPRRAQRATIDLVDQHVPSSMLVVTDDQALVAEAGRMTPPSLVDTSNVRIEAGSLTLDELIRVTQDERAAVLFTGGRFDEIPGFRQWADQHLTRVADVPDGGALYLPT